MQGWHAGVGSAVLHRLGRDLKRVVKDHDPIRAGGSRWGHQHAAAGIERRPGEQLPERDLPAGLEAWRATVAHGARSIDTTSFVSPQARQRSVQAM